uniref:Rap guanine nucleotide exchange factor (GEF) 1b n=1 Tax=Gadus morhua TaxID=8049 RepID=A0A8C4Z484_GADMO
IDTEMYSQRSQLASLTMRLKDKLHPPRIKRSVEKIKRTPSQASANKPHDLDLTATPPLQRKSVCVLEEQERAVLSALRYFKKLLDTLGGDQPVMNSLLSGSAGQVLETVHNLVQLEPHIHNSKTVTCCLSGLYSSLAQLIHWADQLMLQGIVLEEKEAIATVVVVTKAVLDGVKELVRLAAERQDGPSPSSPIQPLSPKDKQNRDRRDSDQSLQAVGQDEIEDQHVSPEHSQNPEPMATTEESAPPKPPKPFLCTAADSSKQGKECNQSNGEDQEENEELLLVSRQEVLDRLTMKSEGEEGPGVKAASPDILLVHATLTDKQVLYCEVFLSTYRTFISPHDVISKLQFRYPTSAHTFPKFLKNTFLLLVRVVDELCSIELDGDLQLLLMDLVFSLVIKGELGLARLLRSNILSKLEERRQMIESPSWLRPLSARGVAARPGSLLDFKSHDVAEQLTFMDSKLFYKIELPEVLLWSMEQNEERSPNLTEFTQHFNNVSFWVRSVIILQEKAQEREKLVLKFLKVMKHLRKLNNFNSYLSILSALDSAPLRRLDWQKHTAEALEEFSALIDSSSSFRTYRTALSEVEPPCIPYLGLILQDLTFVHLGNPDRLMTSQGSMVNFSKRWQQFNILDTLRSFQQICYSLQPKSEISSFFNDFSDHLAEEALWELSLKIRPRNIPKTNQR